MVKVASRTSFLPGSCRPPSTKTERTSGRVRTLPEVRSVFVDGGRQLPGKKEVRLATFTINLTPCGRGRSSASG
jgi:hypothetical protein